MEIKDIAIGLYKNSQNVKPTHEWVVEQNIQNVTKLSQEIALANKSFFKEKLATKLSEDQMKHIKVVDPELGEVPYVDRYGRVTYYYAELAGRKIWLYQPGTIMFESGVKDGDLKVCSGGSQQNGPILGNGCAAFLCKFVVNLIEQYEKIKKEEEID